MKDLKTLLEVVNIKTKDIVKTYFETYIKEIYDEELEEEIEYHEYYSVIHGVWFSDMMYSIDDIFLAIQNEIPYKIVDDYYGEMYNGEIKDINLYSYWRRKTISPEELEKERLDDIEESEQKVEKARELLEEMMQKDNF